jgi:hypothetical protein
MADISNARNLCDLQEICTNLNKKLVGTVTFNESTSIEAKIYIKDSNDVVLDEKTVTPNEFQKCATSLERLLFINARDMVANA